MHRLRPLSEDHTKILHNTSILRTATTNHHLVFAQQAKHCIVIAQFISSSPGFRFKTPLSGCKRAVPHDCGTPVITIAVIDNTLVLTNQPHSASPPTRRLAYSRPCLNDTTTSIALTIEIMAAVAAGAIDIDKPGKYDIVLSDALLGGASKEVYTGIRCT